MCDCGSLWGPAAYAITAHFGGGRLRDLCWPGRLRDHGSFLGVAAYAIFVGPGLTRSRLILGGPVAVRSWLGSDGSFGGDASADFGDAGRV